MSELYTPPPKPAEEVEQPAVFANFAGTVASLSPDRAVEHTAFDTFHEYDPSNAEESDVFFFVQDYIVTYSASELSFSLTEALSLLVRGVYGYADSLAREVPDNVNEIRRRLRMWNSVVRSQYTADMVQEIEIDDLVRAAYGDWLDTHMPGASSVPPRCAPVNL